MRLEVWKDCSSCQNLLFAKRNQVIPHLTVGMTLREFHFLRTESHFWMNLKQIQENVAEFVSFFLRVLKCWIIFILPLCNGTGMQFIVQYWCIIISESLSIFLALYLSKTESFCGLWKAYSVASLLNVCLNLHKFGCYLMHVGSIPRAYILGMVFLILVEIKKTSFPFYFFQLNPEGERRSKEKSWGGEGTDIFKCLCFVLSRMLLHFIFIVNFREF